MHARGHAHIWTQGTARDTATVTATGVQTEVKTAVEVLSMYA